MTSRLTSKHSFGRLSGAKERQSYALLNPPSFALRATEGRPVEFPRFLLCGLLFRSVPADGRPGPPGAAAGETFRPETAPRSRRPAAPAASVCPAGRGPAAGRPDPTGSAATIFSVRHPAPLNTQRSTGPAQGGLNGNRGSTASRTIGWPQPGQLIAHAGRGGGGGGAFQSSSANTRAHFCLAAGLPQPK